MKKCFLLICLCVFIGIFITGCSGDTVRSDVDIDLTELSITMMQAEFNRIISDSDDYIGKTIRAGGTLRTMLIDNAGNYAHYIVVIPGDDCCWSGFEFKRDESYNFPRDYPRQDASIVISGTLSRYRESGVTYLYIAVDEFSS